MHTQFGLVLIACAQLSAQGFQSSPPGGHWTFGIIRQSPGFDGSYLKNSNSSGSNGSNPTTSTAVASTGTNFDTNRDLGLGKDNTGIGLLADYEGRRFLLHLATYSQSYAGNQVTSQDVNIKDTTYKAGTRLQSTLKVNDYELDWTIKLWRWEAAYLGLDLGFNSWNINVSASGNATDGNGATQSVSADDSVTVPIPQIGVSAGGHIGDRVDLRGYYNLLTYKGASYHRAGADLRYFPLKWLGVRLNVESEGFKVPLGSIGSDTAINITKNGMGLGLLARF